MQRRRHGRFGALYRAAAGGQDPGTEPDHGPGSLRDMLASRRPPAVFAPLSPETSPRPAAESAALATAVAGQQGAAAPTNTSGAAPTIPPPPAAAHIPPPPAPRAYPMPIPGSPPPVSGFWGGAPPQAPAAPAVAPVAPSPPSDAAMAAGALVDTSAWTPADFQAAAAATGNFYNPLAVGPPGSASANVWASTQVSQQRHPVDQAAQAQATAENNALRAARTAAMGQLVSRPMSTPVSNPAEVAARFDQSGYTGAQALADGWDTGTGRAGWEALPGYTNQLNPQGLMGAPYVNQTPAQASAPAAAPAAQPPAPGPVTPRPEVGPPPGASPTPAQMSPAPVVDTHTPLAGAPPERPAGATQPPAAQPPMRHYS